MLDARGTANVATGLWLNKSILLTVQNRAILQVGLAGESTKRSDHDLPQEW